MSDKKKSGKLLSNLRSRFVSVPKLGLRGESETYDTDSSTASFSGLISRPSVIGVSTSENPEDAVEILNPELFKKYFGGGNSKGVVNQEFKTYFAECYDMQWLEMQDRNKITSLTWNPANNCFACGCSNGLLKVIQVNEPRGSEGKDDLSKTADFPIGYLASPTKILINETLAGMDPKDGHNELITALAWNPVCNKLASGDASGLFIVWQKNDGKWSIEKKNSENSSSVIEIQWSNDGERVCIAYEDGEILIGSKGKEKLKKMTLKEHDAIADINWSPISPHLLVAFWSGTICLYDQYGESKGKFKINECEGPENRIQKVCWYGGKNHGTGYRIAVILKSDKLYLYKSISGKDPKVITTNMINKCAAWSSNGLFLCIAGAPVTGTKDSYDQMQIYNASGNLLFKLNIPYKGVQNVTWDLSNLRVGIALGSNIFFANIRPFYKACYFGNNDSLILYSYTKTDKTTMLNIWDGKTVVQTTEIPGRVIDMKANNSIGAVLTFDSEKHSIMLIKPDEGLDNKLNSVVCEELSPFCLILLDSSAIALARNAVFMWKYKFKDLSFAEADFKRKDIRNQKKAFHIDSIKSAPNEIEMLDLGHLSLKTGTLDPIICGDAKENILIVGRKSGKFHLYSLPKVRLLCIVNVKEDFDILPKRVFLNSDGTKLGFIDNLSCLSIYSLKKQIEIQSLEMNYENVKEMVWAKDLPDQFGVKKLSEIFIVSNDVQEKPILKCGNLLNLKNMELKIFDLDELMHDPENPKPSLLSKHESEAMKNIREMLASTTNKKKINFEPIVHMAQKTKHPELWKMITKKAMYDLNLEVGERGFIETENYAGISLINKIRKISNDYVKLGKIAIHYKEFQEAEKYFGLAGRNDLINELRADLGQWNKVAEDVLFHGLSAKEKADFQTTIGNYLAEKGDWAKAKMYYNQAGSHKEMLRACLITEDYDELMKLVSKLPENSPYFDQIGMYFAGIGCCEQAVEAYVAGKLYEKAVNCCLTLNNCGLALEISQKFRIRGTQERIFQKAAQLVKDGLIVQAIDLFKLAKQPIFGIWIAAMFALRLVNESKEFDLVLVSELFQLSLQLSEEAETDPNTNLDPQLFVQFMPKDMVPSREIKEWLVSKPNRGVIALKTFVKLQKHLYAGNYKEGVESGIKLMNYTDIFGKERVGSLVVLISANCKRYDLTSKAFMLLESENPEKYKPLAFQFFADVDPVDMSEGGAGDMNGQGDRQKKNSLLELLNKLNMKN